MQGATKRGGVPGVSLGVVPLRSADWPVNSSVGLLVEVGRNVRRQQRKVTVRLGQERESSSGSESRGGAGWLDAGGTLMSLVAAATKQLAQHDSCSW